MLVVDLPQASGLMYMSLMLGPPLCQSMRVSQVHAVHALMPLCSP